LTLIDCPEPLFFPPDAVLPRAHFNVGARNRLSPSSNAGFLQKGRRDEITTTADLHRRGRIVDSDGLSSLPQRLRVVLGRHWKRQSRSTRHVQLLHSIQPTILRAGDGQ
jgi:hypothetical protein